jgi:hypothetical protein
MPITKFQNKILRAIAENRSPENYLAGATVIHRAENSPRFSHDLDFFHDIEESVAQSAESDAKTLTDSGYDVEWLLRSPSFHRALVSADKERIRLEWAQDSAFRFFPVQEDDFCGYRLHDVDAAINKTLALGGRQEIRDFVDILHLDDNCLSIGTMAWAACGKDPGFTPDFLLDHIARHVAYSQADLDLLSLKEPLDLHQLKQKWILALEKAKQLANDLPADEIGCLYLNSDHSPITPDPESDIFSKLTRHYGCISGAWPTVRE